MKQTDRVKFCNCCKNQKYSYEEGTICGLTDKRADFEGHCSHFEDDGTFVKAYKRWDFLIILYMVLAVCACLTSIQDIMKVDFSTVGIDHMYGLAYDIFRVILSIYIIYALLAKRKNAIYWCLVLPGINIIASILMIIIGLINLDVMAALGDYLPAIVVNSAWFVYFIRSEYIRRTYEPQDADYTKDKYILTFAIVLLLSLAIAGMIF